MNAELAEQRTALMASVARFAEREIAPHVAAWDAAGEFPRALYAQAAEMGLLGLGYPESLGGTPAPWTLRLANAQTISRHGGSGGVLAGLFSHNIALPPILAHGSAEMQRRLVPPVLRGEQIAALAITEAGGGSDVARIRTTARRDGDHWRIDGDKKVIRHKLVDMRMRIASTQAWVDTLGERADAGDVSHDWVAEVCMLKNHATQTMQHCADQAVQLLGGMGFMRGLKSERIYREVKVMMIGGGAEEIMKDLAARQIGL